MGAKVWEGFDHYNNTNFLADMFERSGYLQWQNYNFMNQSGGSPTYSLVTGLDGDGKALKIYIDEDIPVHYPLLAAVVQQRVASAFIGARVFIPNATGFDILFYDTVADVVQCSVHFNLANYAVIAYRGTPMNVPGGNNGVQIGYSSNNVWAPDILNFIEVWPVINTSTGSIEVLVNGEVVLNVTGVDTQTTGNAWWDAAVFAPRTTGFVPTYVTIDDFYYADTTSDPGSYPSNTPLGDAHVYTKFAVGNDSVQFTPLANTNWQEISEVQFDGDLSYNFSATVGQQDTFNFSPLEATINKIIGLQITGAYRKDDAGMRIVNQTLKSGATTVYGSNYSVPDNYVYFTDRFILDPNTSASWGLTAANAASAGYKLVS